MFVTGGSGLVGSHLVPLLRGAGFQVRALHRPTSDVRHLRSLGCELVQGSLEGSRAELIGAMEGCDGLVHSAALVMPRLPWARIRAVNVDGTAQILAAGLSAGIRTVVHISSVSVYGALNGPVDESSRTDLPLHPRELYARSKREAEGAVRELTVGEDVSISILRAAALYGERDRLLTPRLAATLGFPIHPLVGGGSTKLPLVYAGNLAQAVLVALENPAARGVRVFNVAEDHPLTQRQLYQYLATYLGARFRPIRVPAASILALSRLGDTLGLRPPGLGGVPLDRAARLLARANPYQSRRIREELGWSPVFSLEEAMERTGRWLRDPHSADN